MNWKNKLTSRKFWMAVAAFITPLLLSFGLSESTVTQIVAIIMAGADVLAYIIAEGMVDAANKDASRPIVAYDERKEGGLSDS